MHPPFNGLKVRCVSQPSEGSVGGASSGFALVAREHQKMLKCAFPLLLAVKLHQSGYLFHR